MADRRAGAPPPHAAARRSTPHRADRGCTRASASTGGRSRSPRRDTLARQMDRRRIGGRHVEPRRQLVRRRARLRRLDQQSLHRRVRDVAHAAAAQQDEDRAAADPRRHRLHADLRRVARHEGVEHQGEVRRQAPHRHGGAAQAHLLLRGDQHLHRAGDLCRRQRAEQFEQDRAADPVVQRLAGDAIGIGILPHLAQIGHRVADPDPERRHLVRALGAHINRELFGGHHSMPIGIRLHVRELAPDHPVASVDDHLPPHQQRWQDPPHPFKPQEAIGADAFNHAADLVGVCLEQQRRPRRGTATRGEQVAEPIRPHLIRVRRERRAQIGDHPLLMTAQARNVVERPHIRLDPIASGLEIGRERVVHGRLSPSSQRRAPLASLYPVGCHAPPPRHCSRSSAVGHRAVMASSSNGHPGPLPLIHMRRTARRRGAVRLVGHCTSTRAAGAMPASVL